MTNIFFDMKLYSPLIGIIIFVIFMFLCIRIYKVTAWARREKASRQMRGFKKEQKRHPLYPLYLKIQIWRTVILTLPLAVIVIIAMAPALQTISWIIKGYPAFFIFCLIANNLMARHMWRCPACGARLKIKKGRSSLGAVLPVICPACKQFLAQNKDLINSK